MTILSGSSAMPPTSANSLQRALRRRIQARRVARRDSRFHTALRVDPQAPVLVLSPHWDDAVLDCWSLLTGAPECTVVNIFAGSPPPGFLTLWDAITGASDSAEQTRARLAEDAVALALAKRTPVNLPFLDNQYRTQPGPPLEQLDRALCAQVPGASHVYVPAGVGGHPDHKLVRRYGRMLVRAGMPVTLYVDLPYCVTHGWPHWVDASEPDPNLNIDAFWLSFLDGVPEMPTLRSAHVERLDDDAAAAKLAAMRSYRTQFPALNGGAKQMLADPAVHRFEVRWELVGDGTGRAQAQPNPS
jgi:LmbE family N-acetylglucosaminyl deacetylase